MYACVLIPRELSLVLSTQPSARASPTSPAPTASLTTRASVWSNSDLRPGTVFYPDEGEVRLDRLDSRLSPTEDETRRSYGSYDTHLTVQGQQVRHCNWVRFVRSTLDPCSANVISSKVRGQAFFQVTQPLKANEEMVVLFHAERSPGRDMDTAGLEFSVTNREENHFTPLERSTDNWKSSELQRHRGNMLERLSKDATTESAASSSPPPAFPRDLRVETFASLSSPKSSLSSSLISSTLSLPAMKISPLAPSLMPVPFAFGGLGMTRSLYDHLTLMPTEQHQYNYQQQQQQDDQRQQVQQEHHRRLSRTERDYNKRNTRERLTPHAVQHDVLSFGATDGVLTSTPISTVTQSRREEVELHETDLLKKDVGDPAIEEEEEEEEAEERKTPIFYSSAVSEKLKTHNPRSLHFGSSFSTSASSEGMSLSVASCASPRSAKQQSDSNNHTYETHNVDDSLRDFSASSPMFTSGSSHSREISSASEACAGDVSGMNRSLDRDGYGQCTSSSHIPNSSSKNSVIHDSPGEEIPENESELLENKNTNQKYEPIESECKRNQVKDSKLVSDQKQFHSGLGTVSGNFSEENYSRSDAVKIRDGDADKANDEDVRAQDRDSMAVQVDSTVHCSIDEYQDREKEIGKAEQVDVKVEEMLQQPTSDGHISSSSNNVIPSTTKSQRQQYKEQKSKPNNIPESEMENKERRMYRRGELTPIDTPRDNSLVDSAYFTFRASPAKEAFYCSRNRGQTKDLEVKYKAFSLTAQTSKQNFQKFSYHSSESNDRMTLEIPRPLRTISDHLENLPMPNDFEGHHDKDQRGTYTEGLLAPQVEPQNLSMARVEMKAETCSGIPETKPSNGSSLHARDQREPIKRCRERTWWPCDVCGKKFDRPSLLKRHTRTHTGEKPHACDVCGKAFSTSSSLNTHRRIHSGEKPHQCKICGKRFTASSNLYYHRMTHNKEKPHKCDLCSKSFPTPGDLRSHMYIHNGSWPFRCDVCNRGFSKQTNLKNHMLLHSGDKPHECSRCGKKFALLCNLKTHLKTHENSDSSDVSGSHCSMCGGPHSLNLSGLDDHEKGSKTRTPAEKRRPNCAICNSRGPDAISAGPVKRSHHGSPHQSLSPRPSELALPKKRPTDFSISKLTAEDNRSSLGGNRQGHDQEVKLNIALKKFERDHSDGDDDDDDDRDIKIRRIGSVHRVSSDFDRKFGDGGIGNHNQPSSLVGSKANPGKGELDICLDDRRLPQPRSTSPPLNKVKSSAHIRGATKHGRELTLRDSYQSFLAAATAAAAAATSEQHHHQHEQLQQPWFLPTPQFSAAACNQLAYPLLFSAPNLQQIGSLPSAPALSAHLKQDIPAASPFHPVDPQRNLKVPSSERLHHHSQHYPQQQLLRLSHQQQSQQQHLLPLLSQPPHNHITPAGALRYPDMTSLRESGVLTPSMPLSFQLQPGSAQWALASHALAQGF